MEDIVIKEKYSTKSKKWNLFTDENNNSVRSWTALSVKYVHVTSTDICNCNKRGKQFSNSRYRDTYEISRIDYINLNNSISKSESTCVFCVLNTAF